MDNSAGWPFQDDTHHASHHDSHHVHWDDPNTPMDPSTPSHHGHHSPPHDSYDAPPPGSLGWRTAVDSLMSTLGQHPDFAPVDHNAELEQMHSVVSKQGRLLARAETALIEADEQNARVESTAAVLSQSQRHLEGEGEKLRQREEEVRRGAVQLERRLEKTNKTAVAK